MHKGVTSIITAAALMAVFAATVTADENRENEHARFRELRGLDWQPVFQDSGAGHWQDRWTLDGLKATVTNSEDGMAFYAGPVHRDNSCHAVLWTKQQFDGDIRIDYEYTKLDDTVHNVTILYIQAAGSGEGPYHRDIERWRHLRQVPSMGHYFNHMHTYHISYAAFGVSNTDPEDDYIRARRYMPEAGRGLRGTELKPEYSRTGLFKQGVPHEITVIKKGKDLYMHARNPEKSLLCHFLNDKLPPITEGRIGLRHMYTRAARYRDFRVSQLSEADVAPGTDRPGASRNQEIKIVDFETGDYSQAINLEPCGDKRGSSDCAEGVSIKVVSRDSGHPVRAGQYASYHRLTDSHERAEVVAGLAGYDTEAWIGFSIYLPDTPQSREFGHILMQFHDRYGGLRNKPPYCPGFRRGGPSLINVDRGEDGNVKLHIRYQQDDCMKTRSIAFAKKTTMYGKWTDFVVHARFINSDRGFYKIWMYEAGTKAPGSNPGDPDLVYTGSTYHQYDNHGPAVRTGPYTGDPGRAPDPAFIMYSDEVRIGKASDGIHFWDVAPKGAFTVGNR
jgi:hypothetical protein